VLVELEGRATHYGHRREEHERREEERQRHTQLRLAEERALRVEQVRADKLRVEVDAWRWTQDAERYLAELRGRLPDLPEAEQKRVSSWCEWVEERISASDPLLRLERVGMREDAVP